jgi:hypothetical protein
MILRALNLSGEDRDRSDDRRERAHRGWEAHLVDELRLVVGPAVGFTGRRLLASVGQVRRLELLSTTPTPGGSVLLAYWVP